MIQFARGCPEIAALETRSVAVGQGPRLPGDEYAFIEFYCDESACDCRRVFFQVIPRSQPEVVLASINFGWEEEGFYRKRMPYDADAPTNITRGSLDPLNEQSDYATELLELFQRFVLDVPYRLRLRRHYKLFKHRLEHASKRRSGFRNDESVR